MNKNIDGRKLKQTCDTNETSHAILTELAARKRMRKALNITRFKFNLLKKEGIKFSSKDYFQCFKDLEKDGCGTVIYGRNGKYDRFEWHYNLKEVAKAILTGVTSKVEVIEQVPVEVPLTRKVMKEKLSTLVYIPLRPGINIKLSLPGDLSESDINVIKSALDSI